MFCLFLFFFLALWHFFLFLHCIRASKCSYLFVSVLLLKKFITNRCEFAIEWFICSRFSTLWWVRDRVSGTLFGNQYVTEKWLHVLFTTKQLFSDLRECTTRKNAILNLNCWFKYVFLCCRWHSTPVLAGSLVFSIMIITLLLFTDRDSVSSCVYFLVE